MLLAIDVGNSNVVFGLHDRTTWQHVWRLETHPLLPSADYAVFVRTQLLEAGLGLSDVRGAVLCTVVPDLREPLSTMTRDLLGLEALVMGPDLYPHLPIRTQRPFEIGADLMANALAAWERFRSAVLVVDFGTALTFTVVSGGGDVVAVNIVPGLKTALRALAGNTAQLPEVPLELPTSVLGRDTVHAIQAGILYGYTDLVSGMIDRMQAELGESCRVLATGGLSTILTNLQPRFEVVDRHLTLDGLRLAEGYVRARRASEE
ncbi:MAG: type III pantothenate kinase [Catalinimonas sp.]